MSDDDLAAAESAGRRWPVVTALVLALAVAMFTGFRVPSTWATTLQSVSVFDGFHRRFLVGTLLRPLAVASDYDYWVFAAFSFLVIAVFVAVLVVVTLRTRVVLRQLLVIVWLLLPTGGFFFHIVGYFDHALYLMLFVALWLVHRGKAIPATCVMALTPFVHEVAILSVMPVFGLALAHALPLRRAVVLTAIPLAIGGFVLAIPQHGSGAIEALVPSLTAANFELRWDALQIFDRTFAQARALYDLHEQAVRIVPNALLVVGAYVAFTVTDRFASLGSPRRWLLLVIACGAIATPVLLIFGGWDSNRWNFFLITNAFLVLWIVAGHRGDPRPPGPRSVVVLVTAMLLVARIPLYYFDGLAPRDLGYPEVKQFVWRLAHGTLFKIPR